MLGMQVDEYKAEIEKAEKALEEGNLELLREILPPLVDKNIPEAIRINSSFFGPEVPEDECDRFYVEGMFKAAELGDLKAKYQVGVFYDLVEYDIAQDKEKASYIFKELAEKGDPHCLWIYACELIWGNGTFPKSTGEGVELLVKASEIGSANVCMTLAQCYDKGEFDFLKKHRKKKRIPGALAMKYDDTMYDPYALTSACTWIAAKSAAPSEAGR